MIPKQGDLFWGMDKEFVRKAMELAEHCDEQEGGVLFHEGDAADHFYIMLTGRVRLSIGDRGPAVYMARQAGELIGWSSLFGRATYSASAECAVPTQLLKIKSKTFLELLDMYTDSSALLYRRLAEMLGNRLTGLYPSLA